MSGEIQHRGLAKTTARYVGLLFGQSMVGRLLVFASQLVLAALLQPADFGLIGLANTIVGLAGAVAGAGVDHVLLARRRYMHRWEPAAYATAFLFGLLVMTLVIAVSQAAASIYQAPALTTMLLILAPSLLVTSLIAVPLARLRQDMRFKQLATLNLLDLILVQALTLLFAYLGMGALSFAIPLPIVAVLKFVFLASITGINVKRIPKPSEVRVILASSARMLSSKLMNAIVGQADYAVLGLIATTSVVGYYYFAFRLAAQPVRMLSTNVENVLSSSLVQLAGDPARQLRACLRATKILCYVAMPIGVLQAICAEPLLELLFGPKWLPAAHFMAILSLGLPFEAATWMAWSLMIARSRFDFLLRATSLSVPLFILFITVPGMRWGASGVAWGATFYYLLLHPIFFMIATRSPEKIPRFAAVYLRPALLCLISLVPTLFVSHEFLAGTPPLVLATGTAALFSAAYVVLVFFLSRDIVKEVTDLLPKQSRASGD